MSKVNQKMAVVNSILSVLELRDVSYEMGGEVKLSDVITDTDKSKVREILFTMFRRGDVEYKESFDAKVQVDSELKKYVSGLLNNWIRKNKDFNCGLAYKPKNPGSRAGSSDAGVKNMRLLLNATTDVEAKAQIQVAIDAKLAEIKASKTPAETIDVESIPEALRHLIPSLAESESE